MTVKQISVFVENKPGKLLDIVRILKRENVDMRALSIGETSDYGILRLIVDKPDEALMALSQGGFVCSATPVIANAAVAARDISFRVGCMSKPPCLSF